MYEAASKTIKVGRSAKIQKATDLIRVLCWDINISPVGAVATDHSVQVVPLEQRDYAATDCKPSDLIWSKKVFLSSEKFRQSSEGITTLVGRWLA